MRFEHSCLKTKLWGFPFCMLKDSMLLLFSVLCAKLEAQDDCRWPLVLFLPAFCLLRLPYMSRFSYFSKCRRFYIILWNCGDHVQWFWQSLSDILQNEIIVLFLTPCFHGCSGMTRKLQPSSALVIFSSICHSQNNVREILKMFFCNKSVRENLKFMGHLQTSLKERMAEKKTE